MKEVKNKSIMISPKINTIDWKKYEKEIYRHFREEFPTAKITRNAKVIGRFSKTGRQIDVLIDDVVAGFEVRIAIDAKYRNRRIDIKDVEAFLGFCSDIGAHKGVMISLNGYTEAASNRAYYDETDLELDVLNFADLKRFQAFVALPYAGRHGVVLPAPFGWIIDGSTRHEGAVATLYQRGYDLTQAQRAREWMYINFWIKDEKASTLDDLIAYQESYIRRDFPNAQIRYRDGPTRKHGRARIRCFIEEKYPAPEYTGFVEFDEFIFFCVMFTPVEVTNRNLRKLNYILRSVLPFRMTQESLKKP